MIPRHTFPKTGDCGKVHTAHTNSWHLVSLEHILYLVAAFPTCMSVDFKGCVPLQHSFLLLSAE